MLTYNTIYELGHNPAAVEILEFYEEQGLITSTDDISHLIDNVFINATVIYTDEVKNDDDLLKWINENYNKEYKDIEEAQNHINIDIIDGLDVYAVIEG